MTSVPIDAASGRPLVERVRAAEAAKDDKVLERIRKDVEAAPGAQHSPGPWTDDPEGEHACIIEDAEGTPICEVYVLPGHSNVSLVQAAPELLAACREAETIIRSFLTGKTVKTHFHEINVLENSIRRAIAKATE